jgi:hypothetical protein
LAASDFALGFSKQTMPQKTDKRNKTPVPAHQSKTGIYNTLETMGQTYSEAGEVFSPDRLENRFSRSGRLFLRRRPLHPRYFCSGSQ